MRLLLLVALLVATACAGPDPSLTPPGAHPASLAGQAWVVVSVTGRSPIAGSEPTIAFTPTGVSGSAGCNHYGGTYRYDPGSGALAFGDLSMTAMACADDARNAFETAFTVALERVNAASFDEVGHLLLSGSGGVIVLANGRQAAGG
jgi:heat shock protein HslJ